MTQGMNVEWDGLGGSSVEDMNWNLMEWNAGAERERTRQGESEFNGCPRVFANVWRRGCCRRRGVVVALLRGRVMNEPTIDASPHLLNYNTILRPLKHPGPRLLPPEHRPLPGSHLPRALHAPPHRRRHRGAHANDCTSSNLSTTRLTRARSNPTPTLIHIIHVIAFSFPGEDACLSCLWRRTEFAPGGTHQCPLLCLIQRPTLQRN